MMSISCAFSNESQVHQKVLIAALYVDAEDFSLGCVSKYQESSFW